MPGGSDPGSLRIVQDPIGRLGVATTLMLVMFGLALGLRVAGFRFLRDSLRVLVCGVVAGQAQ